MERSLLVTEKILAKTRTTILHRIDWDHEVVDPQTGEKHKLKDTMKAKFDEKIRRGSSPASQNCARTVISRFTTT